MCKHYPESFAFDVLANWTSVFVNGRSRPVIMENMRQRIARGDITTERAEAIKVSDNGSKIKLIH